VDAARSTHNSTLPASNCLNANSFTSKQMLSLSILDALTSLQAFLPDSMNEKH
jgi:hypothetical protein